LATARSIARKKHAAELFCAYDSSIMIAAKTDFDLAAIAQLLDRYHQGIALFVDAVHKVPEAQMDSVPASGKWTARQIVCHVADSEAVAAVRYRMIAAQPGSTLSAFDQERWERELHYPQQPVTEALDAFKALRLYNVNMLRGLPPGHWGKVANHEERGPYSLFKMVEHNATHVEGHTGQVLSLLDSVG
jgi:hypothetical protein